MTNPTSGTITALVAQAHDSQRVSLFLNGAYAIGVSLTTVAREKLFVGKPLTEADYARLEQAEVADRALQAALHFLESRPRSASEIRERLRRKGFAAEAIDPALERLAELGLADDAAFARFWVEARLAGRPRGAGALRNELRRKGVPAEAIAASLDDEELVGDEQQRAWSAARTALRKYADAPDRATFSRRLGSYLMRRGFDAETVRPILAQLWGELRDQPPTETDE